MFHFEICMRKKSPEINWRAIGLLLNISFKRYFKNLIVLYNLSNYILSLITYIIVNLYCYIMINAWKFVYRKLEFLTENKSPSVTYTRLILFSKTSVIDEQIWIIPQESESKS